MSSETTRQAAIIVAVLSVCAAVLFMLWQAGTSAHASHLPASVLGVEHNDLGVEQPPLSKHASSEPSVQTLDLSVMDPRVGPGSLAPSGNAEATVLVHYDGNEPAPTSTLRFYRSVDAVISSSDTELVSYEVSFLPLEVRKGYSYRFIAPASAGTHYYGACVDATAGESNSANNCSDAATLKVVQSD